MKAALTTLWILALAAALYVVTGNTWTYAKRDYRLLAPPPLTDLDPRFLNIVTLGHRGLYDDFVNIWMLQVLFDERLASQSADDVYRTLLKVTRNQPKIESLYMVSCFVLAIDFQRPELCQQITLDGLKAFPDSWRIPVTQGFMYAYKMNDVKNAAMYYGLAASREDAPDFLKKLAVNMVERNQLSVEELQTTLENLLSVPGGTRFGTFLKEHGAGPQRREGH